MKKKFILIGLFTALVLISSCVMKTTDSTTTCDDGRVVSLGEGCIPDDDLNYSQEQQTYKECIKKENNKKLSLSEAREIAINSKCVEDGSLTDKSFCNEDTGTWWIDLDLKKEGCAPACVINIETKTAEINWRCTGLLPG